MKVLLIDDNIVDMKPFCDELEQYDINIVQADTYKSLVKILESTHTFDFIILDLMMPPGDDKDIPVNESDSGYRSGEYLFKTLCKNKLNNCPFIVFTAMDTRTSIFNSSIEELKAFHNYAGWLSKPAEVEDFLNLITIHNKKQ